MILDVEILLNSSCLALRSVVSWTGRLGFLPPAVVGGAEGVAELARVLGGGGPVTDVELGSTI